MQARLHPPARGLRCGAMLRRPLPVLLAVAALAGGALLGAGCGGDESSEITPIPTETVTGDTSTTDTATTATTETATAATVTVQTVTTPPSTAQTATLPPAEPQADPGDTGGAVVTEPNGGTPAGSATGGSGSGGGASAPQQDPDCKPGTGPGFPDRPQCEPVEGPDARDDEGG